MLKITFFFCFLSLAFNSKAQVLHHQSIGTQGNTFISAKGFGVSQSIGQQSIGGNTVKNFVIQQGFIQSMFYPSKTTNPISKINAIVKVYPNPFVTSISCDFANTIDGQVEVRLYDNLGRLVYSSKEIILQNRVVITPPIDLNVGIYLLSLSANQFNFSTQLIKSN